MRKTVVTGAISLVLGALLAFASAPSAYADGALHVVQPGETLFSIALHHGTTVQSVAAANGIYNPNTIFAGQRLSIPGATRPAPAVHAASHGGTYVVRPGDTLYAIAWRHGTTISALLATNGISNPDYVYAGQRLSIPGAHKPVHRPAAKECGYYHRVSHGETLSAIAWRTGTTVNALARANGIGYPYMIFAGQSLHVPCASAGTPVAYHPAPPPPAHHKRAHRKPVHRKPAPSRPKTEPAACSRRVQIVSPHDKAHVSGTLHIVGTANIDNFQFYKLEYAPGHGPLDSEFASIGEVVEHKITDSTLGVWYVGNLAAGKYTLRLTAVDNSGSFPRPCDVHLHVNS